MSDLDRLKRESVAMIRLLKKLDKEETELRRQSEILAREALMNGFELEMLEPAPPKRRKPVAKKGEHRVESPDAEDQWE
jgi:hypothetical protein